MIHRIASVSLLAVVSQALFPAGEALARQSLRGQASRPSSRPARDDARSEKAKIDLQVLGSALDYYIIKNGSMPAGLDVLVRKDEKGHAYLERLPKDPWGNDYVLIPGPGRSRFVVMSRGPDAIADTEDDISHPPRDRPSTRLTRPAPPRVRGPDPLQKAAQDLEAIATALSFYIVKNGSMPAGLDVLVRKDEKGHAYLERLPLDPWGNDYVLIPGPGRIQFVVMSRGPDAIADTEDDISHSSGTKRR